VSPVVARSSHGQTKCASDPAIGPKIEPSIEPAIDRALAAYPRELARRAAPLIHRLLDGHFDGRTGSYGSRLTGDGFPFELGFSTGDDGRLRFTACPAGDSPIARFRDECRNAGVSACEGDGVWRALAELQRGAAPRHEAWIGGRVDGNGVVLKAYVRVPEGARVPAMCPQGPALPDRPVVPRMIGYTPSTDLLESYFRIPSLEPEHVVGLLGPARMGERTRRLLEFLEHAYGYRLRGRLPGPSVGVSYATRPQGHRVSLHFYARSLWGSDARIRNGFIRLAAECGWNTDVYREVTEPMAARERWTTYHGLFGITLDESCDDCALSIGVRPIAS
jgi:hypothetical protein